MKIAPVTFQNTKSISANKKINFTANPIKRDIFIKSKPVEKTLEEQFLPLEKEINEYFSKTKNVDCKEITNILKKYFPNIEINISPCIEAQNYTNPNYTSEFSIKKQLFKKFKLAQESQKIEIKITDTSALGSKELLESSILHECIHALQDNSSDKINQVDFLNNLIKKYPKITPKEVKIAVEYSGHLENFMSEESYNYLGFDYENSTGTFDDFLIFKEKVKNYKTFSFDDVARQAKKSGEDYIANYTMTILNYNQIKEIKAVCEYLIHHAQREIEAYQKAIPKNFDFVCSAINFDTHIQSEIQKTILKASKKLLNTLK